MDDINKLEKLGELRDKGLLTEEEFQAEKTKLLSTENQSCCTEQCCQNNTKHNGWLKPLAIIATIIVVLVVLGALIGHTKYAAVMTVKNGTLNSCPNHSVDTLINTLVKSPKWSSRKDGNKTFVVVRGGISYLNKPARVALQFEVSENNSFHYDAIEINDKPMLKLIGIGLLGKMCTHANK